jgi:hypothetical protein
MAPCTRSVEVRLDKLDVITEHGRWAGNEKQAHLEPGGHLSEHGRTSNGAGYGVESIARPWVETKGRLIPVLG